MYRERDKKKKPQQLCLFTVSSLYPPSFTYIGIRIWQREVRVTIVQK